MPIRRLDNVSITVDDLDGVIAFFVALGMELEGRTTVEGESVDRLLGLVGVRSDVAMLRSSDGQARIELSRFHAPAVAGPDHARAVNTPGTGRIMFAVDDIDAVVARAVGLGATLVGDVVQYGDSYRLCYLRGPEPGILIALAEELPAAG